MSGAAPHPASEASSNKTERPLKQRAFCVYPATVVNARRLQRNKPKTRQNAGMIAPLNCVSMYLRTSSDSYAATSFFTHG